MLGGGKAAAVQRVTTVWGAEIKRNKGGRGEGGREQEAGRG